MPRHDDWTGDIAVKVEEKLGRYCRPCRKMHPLSAFNKHSQKCDDALARVAALNKKRRLAQRAAS